MMMKTNSYGPLAWICESSNAGTLAAPGELADVGGEGTWGTRLGQNTRGLNGEL
jgi:hypothetical protein